MIWERSWVCGCCYFYGTQGHDLGKIIGGVVWYKWYMQSTDRSVNTCVVVVVFMGGKSVIWERPWVCGCVGVVTSCNDRWDESWDFMHYFLRWTGWWMGEQYRIHALSVWIWMCQMPSEVWWCSRTNGALWGSMCKVPWCTVTPVSYTHLTLPTKRIV